MTMPLRPKFLLGRAFPSSQVIEDIYSEPTLKQIAVPNGSFGTVIERTLTPTILLAGQTGRIMSYTVEFQLKAQSGSSHRVRVLVNSVVQGDAITDVTTTAYTYVFRVAQAAYNRTNTVTVEGYGNGAGINFDLDKFIIRARVAV